MTQSITHYDFLLLNYIQSNLHSSFGDFVMPYITMLGNGGAIWIIIAIGFLFFKNFRLTGLKISLALFFCLLFGNILLKQVFARIRPCDINTAISLLISRPLDYSFPSGHTMSSFAAAMVLFLTNKKIGIPALILAAFISFSRLYLYVHFPTDVLAGAVLGILFAHLSIKIIDNKISE